MTIVTYKFNLEDPDDRDHLKAVQQAKEMKMLIWDFTHNTKHTISKLDEKQLEGFDIAMIRFWGMIEEYDVDVE